MNWEELKNPPGRYRAVPLWSWNDKLEKAELERQLEEMQKAGIGGFFMHARGGLKTPYMSEEWMEAVRTCLLKSRELGLSPWLYDENGWPSGFAGGAVPAKGLAYQQKQLAYELAPFAQPDERTIAWYAKAEGGYALLPNGCRGEGADLRLYYEVNPYYIDSLSVQAVRAFLNETHERYWERFGAEFGGEVPGIFTDEPQFARGWIPWSFELEEEFRSRHGWELKEALPDLFFDTADPYKARYAFWETVTAMFVTAYAKQIGDWCGERGWSSVGHVVDEQELTNQVTSVGDPMAFYEHLQVPGCDWLGRFTGEDPVVPKQVSSAARQLGRKQAITESFGCSGWNASFGDLKRIAEWQFVHGINLLCPHLEGYSLRGLRKRDYPPSLFYQQPWWEDYRAFNDYMARLSMLLSEGARQAEALLLHPVRSAWVLQHGTDKSAIAPYHESFARLSRWLCQSFLEHDYGSESLIEGHGRVEGGRFIIGEAAYRAVVIPPSVTLSRSTFRLLEQFAAEGGRIVAFAPYPTRIDGKASGGLEGLLAQALKPQWSRDALVEALADTARPFVRAANSAGAPLASDSLNLQTLSLNGSSLYFLVHSGEERYDRARIELAGKGRVHLIDLLTGDSRPIPQKETETGVEVALTIYPYGSYMLRLEPEEQEVGILRPDKEMSIRLDRAAGGIGAAGDGAASAGLLERADEPCSMGSSIIPLDRPWTVARMELNSLTLDYCRFRVENGGWSGVEPVIFVQKQLLAYGRPVHVELEFQFRAELDAARPRELYLALEQPENWAIELNGRTVEVSDCGFWRDISFRKISIAGLAVRGVNTIRLKTRFWNSPETYEAIERAKQFEAEENKLTLDTEIESLYLVGSFGVESLAIYADGERSGVHTDGPFVLTEPPAAVVSGDLVRQGLPFFAGGIALEQTVVIGEEEASRAKWVFAAPPDAIVTRLYVNGEEVQKFFWEPYEADLTGYLHKGENLIRLELANSCRNLLGPHHHIKGEVYKIGPDSFKDKPGWTDRDIPADISIYTDRYTFVRFGLQAAPYIELIHPLE